MECNRRLWSFLCVLVCLQCAGPVASSPAQDAGGEKPRKPSAFRGVTPRADKTIFSPLVLPTPNRVRLASGAPGPDYWQQEVDYRIEASLDPGQKLIRGRESVTYVNNAPESLDYLWLNLPQNIFKPTSIAARAGGRRRGGSGTSAPGGGFTIGSLTHSGNPLVHHVFGTIARVELPHPVPGAGGRFTFELEWSFVIDNGAGRMGIRKGSQGPVFELAQWFPNVCVYDDTHGWNTLPFMGPGEFYTNFGSYDVKLTVPRDHIVAATGVLQNPKDVLTPVQRERLAQARKSTETVTIRGKDEVTMAGSRPAADHPLTWHFKAENVRTFAWASSKAFIWDASFLADSGPEGAGTLVQSVYPVEAMPLWGKSTHMLRFAIEGYNKRWFRYPYPVATNVNGIAGGMEYPMIIFCSARGSRSGDQSRAERALYGVTAHEIGHNWFPMTVNTDERRHAWMDEGFNTFINHYSEREFFGKDSRGRTSGRRFARTMKIPNQPPVATEADRLAPRMLGMLEYAKTGVALRLLREQVLGPERFDLAFRTYIRRWAFKSPRPADFYRCMEDAAGADLAWFWRGWFVETGTLDQAVGDVRMLRDGKRARATIENLAKLVMPVHLQVTYSDGSTERRSIPVEAWFSSNRIRTTWDTQGRKLAKIEIDPDGAYPDIDAKNNVWTAPAKPQ